MAMAVASGAIRLMRFVRTFPGPTSRNVSTPSLDHPLHGGDPVDAGGEVLDELGAGAVAVEDGAGVGVGEERGRGFAELDVCQHGPHAVGGLCHQRRVGGDADRQDQRALRAELLGDLGSCLDGGALAGHHDLAGRVAVRDGEDAVLAGARRRAPGGARRRGRGSRPWRRRGPAPEACISRPRSRTSRSAVGEREGARGDHRRVLAHRVAGVEPRVRDRQPVACRPLVGGGEVRDRSRQERRLGVLGSVQELLGALEGERRDRLAEGLVGGRRRSQRRPARRQPGRGPCRRTAIPGRERRGRSCSWTPGADGRWGGGRGGAGPRRRDATMVGPAGGRERGMCARVHTRRVRSRISPRCRRRPAAPRPFAPLPAASRRTWERRCSPPGRASRTSARSPSGWRWAGPCGATSSSGSPRSSGSCGSASPSLLPCTSSRTAPRRPSASSPTRSAARRRRRAGWSTAWSKRRLVERHEEPEDRRQRSLTLTQRGQALLRAVDRARADQFLTTVRPMPTPERALVAMGVAALATHAISRRGRLIKGSR